MRNLWNLISQYHVALLFVILQGLSLAWFVSSHGYPRGKWVKRTMEWQGAWNQRLTQWKRLSDLEELNRELLAENASLRAAVFAAETGSVTRVQGAEVIRSTWSSSANHFVINQGTIHGIAVGQGVTQGGKAAGKIIEVSENYALGLPLVNTEVEWSARIAAAGPVGRLTWDGHAIDRAILHDIPLSAKFNPGDLILTSGFQGCFPAGLTIGWVSDEDPQFDGQFLNVPIQLAADFRALRYVELTDLSDRDEIESVLNTTQTATP